MRVELTMADVAVCALLPLAAGPAAVLTIKSWMSIMSPAKVPSPKIKGEGCGKVMAQRESMLFKYSKLGSCTAASTISCCLFQETPASISVT